MRNKPKITITFKTKPAIVNGIAGIERVESPKEISKEPIVEINEPAENTKLNMPITIKATW